MNTLKCEPKWGLMKSCKFTQLEDRWDLDNFSKQLVCNCMVQFQPFQNAAHEEHLDIIRCENNDNLRKGKQKDGFYESSWVISAGDSPPGATSVLLCFIFFNLHFS